MAGDFEVPISSKDASPKCRKRSIWFHFLHSAPRHQRLVCYVLFFVCTSSRYHFLPAQMLFILSLSFSSNSSGCELVPGIDGGALLLEFVRFHTPVQYNPLHWTITTLALLLHDLRVLKTNFFKRTFIATLCSAPKSMSFWQVMHIGHLITARLDVLYFLSCAVRPPWVNIFRSSGSINFEWASSRKMTWVFSSTKLLLKAFCFVIIAMYLDGMTRVIAVSRFVFPMLGSPIRHITFSLCCLVR